MSKFTSFIFLGIMVSLSFIIFQPVHAATLYDNGPSTHSGGSSIGQFIAADDFVFDTNVMISGASVDVNDGPASEGRRWDGTVEWWILDDNGGAPGNVVASGVGHNIMQTKLDVSAFDYRDFTVYFHFGQTIPMTAGQTYWLALHFQADYTRMSVVWDFNDFDRNNTSYSSGELVGGVPDFTVGGTSPHDKAFRLTHRGYVLYDNGPSTHSGGSSIGLFIAADDFVFTADTIITGASVDVSDGPATENRRWDGNVEWWILDDNGGAPGNVIASGPGRNITQIDLVTSTLGFRDFTVDFDFGRRIAVTAGQSYWLALHFQEDYSRMSVAWDFTDTPRNNLSYSAGELVGGVPDFTVGGTSPHDKAFRLTRYDTATCPAGDTTDTDGDGLFDCWEINGIDSDGDGTIDLELYDVDGDGVIEDDPNGDGNTDDTERADSQHRDLYMEIDWMAQHQPVAAAVDRVINSFANAPVNNPDGTQGIRLHIQADEQALAHDDVIAFEPCTGPAGAGVPDFDDVKTTRFGTAAERADPNSVNLLNAKRLAFHYVLFVHNLLGKGFVSGCAELPGNDFVVSLGGYINAAGNLSANPADGPHWAGVDHHDGTLMHEFGHNLNLRHGGSDNINCKPNYLSIMSYCRQFDNQPIAGRPLDYSGEALDPLDETDLSEPAGIGGPAGDQTAFGPTPVQVVPADQPINWNRDPDSIDTGVSADINDHGFDGCRGFGADLKGFNDWENLQYNLRDSVDFADGVHVTVTEEIKLDEAAKVSPDSDGDGIVNLLDNCPFVANTDQADANGNGFGDACEPVANAGPDQTVECASPTVTPVHLDGSGSYDPGGDLLTFTWTWSGGSATGMNPTIDLPLGSHTITLIVSDGTIDSEPDTVNITVVDTTGPVITPPPDVTVECLGSEGQTVDIGVATATDACCLAGVTPVNDAPPIFYLGETVITWTATDCHGNTGTATQKVTVQDTTAPELSVSISPEKLWPPNHKMVEVVPSFETSDVCCGSDVTVELVSVVSNEPDMADTFDPSHDTEAVSGHKGGDIQIRDGKVFLRSERAGKGDGRVYTLTYMATDCAENTTTESVTVTVPHDRR